MVSRSSSNLSLLRRWNSTQVKVWNSIKSCIGSLASLNHTWWLVISTTQCWCSRKLWTDKYRICRVNSKKLLKNWLEGWTLKYNEKIARRCSLLIFFLLPIFKHSYNNFYNHMSFVTNPVQQIVICCQKRIQFGGSDFFQLFVTLRLILMFLLKAVYWLNKLFKFNYLNYL